jgi:hypothetical protein
VKKFLTLMLFGFSLAACGGGGGAQSPTAPVTTPTAIPDGTSGVTFVIEIPMSSSQAQRRRPEFVASTTQSIGYTFNNVTGANNFFNVGPTAPNCTVPSANVLRCTASFPLSPGNYTFTLIAYDHPGAAGNQLAYATGTFAVSAGVHNVPTITMNGILKSLRVTTNPRAIANFAGITINVNVDGLDQDGNVISSGSYDLGTGTPPTVTLSTNDTSGSVHLSQTSVTGPTSGITATYDGVHPISNLIISATETNGFMASGQATVAVSQGPAETFVANSSNGNQPYLDGYAFPFMSTSTPNFNASVGAPTNLPNGVAFDYTLSANMAITFANGNIFVYPGGPGASTLPAPVQLASSTVANGFDAFDLNGNLFVATQTGKSVLEFDSANGVFSAAQTPTTTITDATALTSPFGVCFDYRTIPMLYVTNNDASGRIVVFTRDPTTGVWARSLSLVVPAANTPKLGGCSEDPYTNKFVVADTNNGTVYIYTLPLTATSVPVQQAVVGPTGVPGLPMDALLLQNTLYVTAAGPNQIQIFAGPPIANPTLIISSGVNGPSAIRQPGF